MKKFIFIGIIIVVLLLIGVGVYVVLFKKTELVPSAFSPRALKSGCGNSVCEESETFESCPPDCTTAGSAEPVLVNLALSRDDLPSPPKQQWQWIQIDSGLVDESYITFGHGQGMLIAWQALFDVREVRDGLEIGFSGAGRIEQDIIIYPKDKLKKAFDSINAEDILERWSEMARQQQTQVQINVQELPNPNIGEMSKVLKMSSSQSSQSKSEDALYILVFVKKNYMEVLKLSGVTFEYNVLPMIARKAADKIK